jgi:hypothetical protein
MIELRPYDRLINLNAAQEVMRRTKDRPVAGRAYPLYHKNRATLPALAISTFVFIGLCGIQSVPSSSARTILCGGLIASFFMLALFPQWLWQRQTREWVGHPKVFVASPDGYVHLSEQLEIVFEQPIERDMTLEYTRIELFERHLTQRRNGWFEIPDDRQGHITTIRDQIKEITTAESQAVKKGDIYKQRASFTLPDHATLNFVSGDAAHIWCLRVTCQCPGFEQLTKLYPLPFPPESKRKEL